jgi:hypothetical protein
MKTKTNENTFCEIFSQRGKRIPKSRDIKPGIYLLDTSLFESGDAWIYDCDRVEYPKMFSTRSLDIDGFLDNTPAWLTMENQIKFIYEATPDQIKLLNTYL